MTTTCIVINKYSTCIVKDVERHQKPHVQKYLEKTTCMEG